MAKSIEAARAFFRIFADDKELQKVVDRVERRLQGAAKAVGTIGARLGGAGAALAAPLIAAAAQFSSFGDEIDKAAARTGISAESISALGFAAEQSGADLKTLEAGIAKMQRSLGELEGPTDKVNDRLASLGLTAAELAGLSPDQQFVKIAEAISRIEDPSKQAAAAFEIFGRSGVRLLPLLQEGQAGIAELVAEADRLGISLSTDQAKAAAVLNDAWNRLFRSMRGLTLQIGAALAPALSRISDVVANVVSSVGRWIEQNGALVRVVGVVAAGLVAAGAVLVAVSGVLYGLSAAVGVLGGALSGLVGLIGAVASPFGLVVAAVAGASAAFLTFTEAGRGAVSTVAAAFADLVGQVGASVGLAGELLAAGQLTAAAELLWAQLRLLWAEGSNALRASWTEWTTFAAQVFIELGAQLKTIWSGAVAGIQSIFVSAWAGIRNAVLEVATVFQNAWSRAAQFIGGLLIRLRGLFDDTFDTDQALEGLNAAAEAARAANSARTDNRQDEINRERDAQLAQIEKERRAALAEIDKRRQAVTDQNFAGRDREIDRLAAEVEAAKTSFADTFAGARETLENAQAEKAEKAKTAAGAIEEGAAGRNASIGGTFEGSVASQIFGAGSSGIAEKQLTAAEGTLAEVREMRKEMKGKVLVYSA